tara:strand:- start:122 stop:589 length:468 start_codon:yes stop_codon:yes gene_type:complete
MTKTPFLVYILPVLLSVGLGTFVMADTLNNSERSLNMWQFGEDEQFKSRTMSLIGLDTKYATSEPIEFQVRLSDSNMFNCGDLYITIYKITNSTKQVVTQSGFLNQCYGNTGGNLPINEKYSELLNEKGNYEILVEIYDKTYKQSNSHTVSLIVN